MNSFVFPLLLGAPDGGASGGANNFLTFVPFVLIIGIFYFLIIRPQNKKQKETQRMLSALKKGDKVITIGGIHGVVQTVKESTVILKVDDGTKIEFSRSSVASVAGAGKDEKAEKAEKADDKALTEGETASGDAPEGSKN